MSMSEFYTADQAEEGIKFPLSKPDGTPTKYWIRIRGVDSPTFRNAELQCRRRAAAAVINTEQERTAATMAMRVELAAELVIDWNLDEPCTPENVQTLFKKAPQIMDAIDRISADRAFFFALKATDSATGSKKNSRSPSRQPEAKAP